MSKDETMKATKVLIAFYSRKGNNYHNGSIVNLSVGNTEVTAQMIQTLAGGDTFKIDTIKAYPSDYTRTTEVAKEELSRNARPELSSKVDNLGDYGVVFLGYPNWWGTAPMAVFTFLESHDFSGKTIIPFCTHEGSGMGHSESDLKAACPGVTVLKGLAIKGGNVQSAERVIEGWLRKSGVIA
jgi:flavodoxin